MYNLKKIVCSNNFSAQFIKIMSHYKKIGYNINVLQQTACLVVNPITVSNFVSSLSARRWVRLHFARVCDFNNRNLFLTAKLLKKGYRYHKIRKEFSKFFLRLRLYNSYGVKL